MSFIKGIVSKQDSVNNKENKIPVSPKEKVKKSSDMNTTSTTNKFSTLVNVFDSLSEHLRRSIRRPRVLKDSNYASLKESSSAQTTPVKLYSPFGIETPSPSGGKMSRPHGGGFIPRRFEFSSPTGKLKKDVKEFSDGVHELNKVVSTLEYKVETQAQLQVVYQD